MNTVGQSVLILAQDGAELAPYVATFQRDDVTQIEVLQQAPGETMSAFKHRLTVRLASIAGAGNGFEHGAFVAKNGFGLADVLATVTLLSCLVTAMVALGTGHVYLCGHAGDAQAGYALEALADAMRDQVRGTGVEVVTDEHLTRSSQPPPAAPPPPA